MFWAFFERHFYLISRTIEAIASFDLSMNENFL